jgi:hypothetical protein
MTCGESKRRTSEQQYSTSAKATRASTIRRTRGHVDPFNATAFARDYGATVHTAKTASIEWPTFEVNSHVCVPGTGTSVRPVLESHHIQESGRQDSYLVIAGWNSGPGHRLAMANRIQKAFLQKILCLDQLHTIMA